MAIEAATELILRAGTPADADEAGRICHEAFSADRRTAPLPSGLPVRRLARAEEQGFPGVRLLQAAYHTRSLSLYANLGFEVREPIATMNGQALLETVPGHSVREAREEDFEACNEICAAVHGHDRAGELSDSIGHGAASVVERDGRICGYTTGIAYFAHSVAETNDTLKAMIGAASEFGGPGFLLPIRNSELFHYYLGRGLRLVQVMTLMTTGVYNEPQGAYLPSILY